MSNEHLVLKGALVGHNGWVTQIATTPQFPDIVLSASRDKSIIIWQLNNQHDPTGESTSCGVPSKALRGHSHFDYEDEILLLPGTYMEVHSQLSPAPGLHIIHLKQIKPMETLLELPFEGNY